MIVIWTFPVILGIPLSILSISCHPERQRRIRLQQRRPVELAPLHASAGAIGSYPILHSVQDDNMADLTNLLTASQRSEESGSNTDAYWSWQPLHAIAGAISRSALCRAPDFRRPVWNQ
jgi:hypothetical protein